MVLTVAVMAGIYGAKKALGAFRPAVQDLAFTASEESDIEQMLAAEALLEDALNSGKVRLVKRADPVERMRAAVALQMKQGQK